MVFAKFSLVSGYRMSPNKTEREYKEAEDDIKKHHQVEIVFEC